MEVAIKIDHINKYFGKRQILHDVSFETYSGEVFGFLGPNGAGKTTTIKMIVGMLSVDSGEISICGVNTEKDFEGAMKQVGAIVENPEMYKYMSGMDNLKQYARMRTGVTKERIQEVVELVGLNNRIQDKVKKYSLGMKQRLGLAQALLHKPKVLILDEPTNGLDPAGIKTLRDILKNLAHKEGVCVIVSSHLMSEMELMCDRVGIIVNGAMIGVKTIDELINETTGDYEQFELCLGDTKEAANVIEGLGFGDCIQIEILDEHHLEIRIAKDENCSISRINQELMLKKIEIMTVSRKETRKLEDVFIELTKEGGNQIA